MDDVIIFQAVKSCHELGMAKLNINNLISSPKSGRDKKIWEILDDLSYSEKLKVIKKNDKWKVSYVSGANFTENKRGFPYNNVSNTEISILQFCLKSNKKYNVTFHPKFDQVRFFKTVRSVKAEMERDPTFSSRLKKWLGLNIKSVSFTNLLEICDKTKFFFKNYFKRF